ncbi:MAG: TetR family transcriptional regulator [Aeromicrobium erythreum]
MSHRREDVVATALRVLDDHGLADLTMRRLAAELDVRPSAIYHHVTGKQALLAAVADEVLRRGRRPLPEAGWRTRHHAAAHALRDALLAFRDGAEVVAAVQALGPGDEDPRAGLDEALAALPSAVRETGATTTVIFVLGHVQDEQLATGAASAGVAHVRPRLDAASFDAGLALLADGIAARLEGRAASPSVVRDQRDASWS